MKFVIAVGGISIIFLVIFHESLQLICEPFTWRCESGTKCIAGRYRCDTDMDCGTGDDSDERECLTRVRCSGEEYTKCYYGSCLRKNSICDGIKDCPEGDNSDEAHCTCDVGQFRCHDPGRHHCIPEEMVCDAKEDCHDGSDEDHDECQSRQCTETQFKCQTTHKCISKELVCNQMNDCGRNDISDEEWSACPCNNTLPRQICHCPPGYYVRYSHQGLQSCVDIDECGMDDICHHICQNLNGSHACSCHDGYVLKSDNKSCGLEAPLLLYQWHSVIMATTPDFASLLPVVTFPNISGFDIDSHTKTVYWISATDGLIGSQKMNDENSHVITENKILLRNLDTPTLITVDWISVNVFIITRTTDVEISAIKICNVGESRERSCATLYELSTINVTGLAVAPANGYIFWTQAHVNYANNNTVNGSIWRARMDGSEMSQLTSQVLNPTGITIDHVFNRVFWLDSAQRIIEAMNFDGTSRTVVTQLQNGDLGNIRRLAIFEDQVILMDSNEMWQCKISLRPQNTRAENNNCTIIKRLFVSNAKFPKILHSVLQPKGGEPPCRHGFCRYICTGTGLGVTAPGNFLLNAISNQYKCICPDGFSSDNATNADCILTANTTSRSQLESTTADAITALITDTTIEITKDTELIETTLSTPTTEFIKNSGSNPEIHGTVFLTNCTSEVEDDIPLNGSEGICDCSKSTTTAIIFAAIAVMVAIVIFVVQAIVYFGLHPTRQTAESSQEYSTRRYIELQGDSASACTGYQVALGGQELTKHEDHEQYL